MALIKKTLYPSSRYTPIPSEFWGAPVFRAKIDNEGGSGVVAGELWCPGFSGATYSKRAWDRVLIQVPFSGLEQPYTPGICEVRLKKGRAVDKKKRAGGDGSRITLHGIQPAEGEIAVHVWTPQQFENLKNLWVVLFPGPQKVTTTTKAPSSVTTATVARSGTAANETADTVSTQTIPQVAGSGVQAQGNKSITTATFKDVTVPFDVGHPTFTANRIKSVIFTEGEGPVDGRTKGEKVFVMKWVEFFLPTSVSTTNSPDGSRANSSAPQPSQFDPPGTNPANTGPTARAARLE